MNLFNLLGATARRYPDAPAICLGSRLTFSYRELCSRAMRIAGGLRLRAKPGDRIAIAAANCPEYIELMFGSWAAGLVIVPINFKLHVREMTEIIADADVRLTFVSQELAEPLGTVIEQERVISIGSDEYADLFEAGAIDPAEISPSNLAWLFYTSGTTGRAKGAMLTHRNLLAMTIAHLADFEDIGPNDSIIHAAPMSHGSGLYILPYIARGARQVIPRSRSYNAEELIELCDTHAGCAAFLAPTMLKRLRLAVHDVGRCPRNIRSIMYGGGPTYITELRRALETFGPVLSQVYGQGEAPMTITGLRRNDHNVARDDVLGSVGWPRSGVEVRVIATDGKTLPAGETGEIVCRGDVVMAGYWNLPEATAEALKDGWLRTGDMGSFDGDGKLTLRDRSKDVIISGATNIYPREVEEVLLSCPGIAEASVVGAPDDEWGERVVAFVVRESESQVTASQLDAHCLAHISRFKRPKRFLFVDALPKSDNGKVLKRELVKRLCGSTTT